MRRDFLTTIQARTARVAIGASTLRNQGARGTVRAARRHLADLNLKGFGVRRASLFAVRLDEATRQLQRRLPPGARGWGTARKALNIFLRDALYCTYLCEQHGLDKCESFLELPLDAITAEHLIVSPEGTELPRWPGVSKLRPEVSELYQFVANRVAKRQRLGRVHLDAYWWGLRRDGPSGSA